MLADLSANIFLNNHVISFIDNIIRSLNINEYRIGFSHATKPGDNWLSVIYKVEVDEISENVDNRSLALILKVAPQDEKFRTMFPIESLFNREIYIYKNVLPEFIRIQEENHIKSLFNPFAMYYNGTDINNKEVLIMEDLKVLGFQSLNHRVSIDYNQALMVIKALGKLHAISFAIRDQKPNLFNEFCVNTEEQFYNGTMYEPVTEILKNNGTKIIQRLENANSSYTNTFKKLFATLPTIVNTIVQSQLSENYSVICHGDYETRNFLFKYNKDGGEVPTDLRLIDWQTSFLGSPIHDISFLFFLCTDKQLRNKYYHTLLDEYYITFSTFLTELGSNSEKMFPRDVFEEHLRKFSIFGLFCCIWCLSLNTKEPDEMQNSNMSSKDDLMNTVSTIPNEVYFSRVIDACCDFIDYGYKF
ncbi:hypothetical protein FQA39_LY03361 [Lamprigera yunnana]|nr:hypothetical protein FQA39_LY03361 [Lamprigera yunnana]